MQLTESPRAEGIRRLYELMLRVNSSTDLSEVLDEIARGVVEVLGYGIAAIARLEGETFVMTTVAGPEEVREQIIGRRTPVASIFNEFAQADEWGVLRFVPHDRMPDALEESAWVPEFEPGSAPDSWHPLDALYAPLYSATGPAARQHVGGPASGQPDPDPGGARAPGDVRRPGRPRDVQRAAARAPRQPGPDGRHAACRLLGRTAGRAGPLAARGGAGHRARPADRAPVDPLLPLRRPRPGRAVGGVPTRRRGDQPRPRAAQERAGQPGLGARPARRDQPGQRLPAGGGPDRGPALPRLGAGPRLRRLQPDVRAGRDRPRAARLPAAGPRRLGQPLDLRGAGSGDGGRADARPGRPERPALRPRAAPRRRAAGARPLQGRADRDHLPRAQDAAHLDHGSRRAARGPRHRHRLGRGHLAQRRAAEPAGARTS